MQLKSLTDMDTNSAKRPQVILAEDHQQIIDINESKGNKLHQNLISKTQISKCTHILELCKDSAQHSLKDRSLIYFTHPGNILLYKYKRKIKLLL